MKILPLFMLGILLSLACPAQEKYTITGEMTRDSLRFTPKAIKKLYLMGQVDGQDIVIDSAEVVNRKFRFEGTAPKNPTLYSITGFDNGVLQIFLEPGNIQIKPFDAHFPVSAQCVGTPANDVYSGYLDVLSRSNQKAIERMKSVRSSLPESISQNDQTFMPYQNSVFHSNNLYYKTAIMKYVKAHIDSPVSLYIIKYGMVPMFTPKVIERQFLRALPKELHTHPMYKELVNQIRASQLAVGSLAPDIQGKTPEGKEVSLSDLKGKYILLDFWASWCAPCRREFPFLKQAMAHSENYDNFIILSYSIDKKEKDWLGAIEKNGLTHKNWLHISDLKGWNSPAGKLFNVEAVPRTILLNPKGEVIAFDLRGEEMLEKVKRIMEGVEKYE